MGWHDDRKKIEGQKQKSILTISTSIFRIPFSRSSSRMSSFAGLSCAGVWSSARKMTRSKFMGYRPLGIVASWPRREESPHFQEIHGCLIYHVYSLAMAKVQAEDGEHVPVSTDRAKG